MTCENCKCPNCNPKAVTYSAKDLTILVKQAKEDFFCNNQEGIENLFESLGGQGRREYFVWALIYQEESVKDFINQLEELVLSSYRDHESILLSWDDFTDLVLFMLIKDEKTRELITSVLMMM